MPEPHMPGHRALCMPQMHRYLQQTLTNICASVAVNTGPFLWVDANGRLVRHPLRAGSAASRYGYRCILSGKGGDDAWLSAGDL